MSDPTVAVEGDVTCHEDGPRRRLRACVEAWPGCADDAYNPKCCRFPKACSPYPYDEALALHGESILEGRRIYTSVAPPTEQGALTEAEREALGRWCKQGFNTGERPWCWVHDSPRIGAACDAVTGPVASIVAAREEAARREGAVAAWEEGVRQAMTWLRGDYAYGEGPEWREDGAAWIADRLAEHTREVREQVTDE